MAGQDDHWIVVTGSMGALGSALATYYGTLGRRVLALDRHFEPHRALPGRIKIQAVDLLQEDDVQSVIANHLGAGDGIALLVNAAGLIWNEPLLTFRGNKLTTHNLESWRNVIDANLTAPFVAAKYVAAHMVRHGGGCIVNFSSIASGGNVGQVAYSAAKAGIEGLTQTMARELGPMGVRVNALALGFIDVPTTRATVADSLLVQYSERTPLGRLGRVEEVISAVEFFASNPFVNGAIVRIDGGLRL